MIPLPAPPPSFPLPLALPLTFSLATLLYQNAALVAGRLIRRHAGTPTTIDSFSVSPFTAMVTLKGVRVTDPVYRQPLIEVPVLSAALSFPDGVRARPNVQVLASEVHFSAVLLSDNLSETNWSRLSDTLWPAQATTAPPPPPMAAASRPGTAGDAEAPPPLAFSYSLTVERPSLTLASDVDVSQPLLSRVPLPTLHLTDRQVSTLSSASRLADDFVIKVVRDAGVRTFPSHVRKQARMWARRAWSTGLLKDMVAWSSSSIPKLRARIQQVDDAARDVGGLDTVRGWTTKAQNTLEFFQRVMDQSVDARVPTEASSPSSESSPRSGTEAPSRQGASSSPEPQTPAAAPESDATFRELDESLP